MKPPVFPALVIALACFVAPRVLAQEVSSDEVLKVNTDLVVVDAQVFTKKNRQVVGDLKREDFELYEDSARREVTYFSRDELPLSVVLLLDVSRSVRPIIERIGEGALAATGRLKPGDEVAVLVFAERAEVVQGFTRDRHLLADKIVEASRDLSVGNGTFLTPGLRAAAGETLRASNPSSRRVVIVVTDNLAAVGGKGAVERTTAELLESGAVVYGLIVRGGFGKFANAVTLGLVNAVENYSEPTGGEVFGADKKEVADKLGEVFARLRTRYSLGFKPADTNEDGRLRQLKLQLTPAAAARVGKVSVVTKEGYYFRRRDSQPARPAAQSDPKNDGSNRPRRATDAPPPPPLPTPTPPA
ncbi:MAG: VWA domain-containing protein [Pyrinomonadaceae bacterium]